MRKYIILFSIVILPLVIYAQFDPKPQIKMPSSEAQSLGKFGEIPVDLFTGKVNVNIPIYTIKYHDIEVPISISYHGGGLKVSDEAGSVGLGWTLNVGGVVNRIVRGMPDELIDQGNKVAGFEQLYNLTLTNGLNRFTEFIDLIKQGNPERDPSSLSVPVSSYEIYLTDMISKYGEQYDKGHFDTAPDNYSFNIQGLTGAFVRNKNSVNEVTLQSNDGVSVCKDLVGYTITDANGYVYQFHEEEKQTFFYKLDYGWYMDNYDGRPEFLVRYPSSWWLSSITSPSGEIVNFYYTETKIVYPRTSFYGYTDVLRRSSSNTFYRDFRVFTSSGQKPDTVYKKIINRIESPNSIVNFYYKSSYPFPIYDYSPHLDSIKVYARSDLNKPIEKTKFTYGGIATAKSYLFELVKQGLNKENKKTHLFAYNSSSVIPHIVINDRRRDHWGYFSSASNGTFSKKIYFDVIPNLGTNPFYTDRYADKRTAADGMLKKIMYPTGGSSEFVWEPHSYSRLSTLGEQAPVDRASESEIISNWEYITDATLSLCGKSANEILSVSRTVNSQRTIIFDLSSYYPPVEWLYDYEYCLEGWNDGNNFNQTNIGNRPHIRVKKDGQLIRIIHICAETCQNPVTLDVSSGSYTFELWNPREALNLSCGGAQMDLYYNDYFNRYGIDASNYGYINILISYQILKTEGSEHKDVGGVRIKRITNTTTDKTVLIKEYDYVEDDSNPQSLSSGVLAYPPRYGSQMSYCETVTAADETGASARITDCPILLTIRSNGLPYSLNGGSHIEYSKVIESVVQTPGLLLNDPMRKPMRKTIYSYWTAADPGCSDIDDTRYGKYIPSDMLQLTSQNHQRGHLKSKVEYTDELKTTTYNYEILESTTTNNISGALFTVGDYIKTGFSYFDGNGGVVKPYKDLGIVQYRVIPYNKRLQSVISESTKLNDYHKYTYRNNIYSDDRAVNEPLSHLTVNSEGDTIIQYFTYKNVNLNKVHTCVTAKDGKIIDAFRNEYDTQGRIIEKYIAHINPLSLPSANNFNAVGLTNVLTESYVYNENRLVQMNDHRSGISTVYIWSYNGTYPVAEIQNATFNNISTILGGSTIENLYHTYSPNINLLNDLRISLPESMISTMTYRMLIGIISYTDPKGITTYFDYDGFGQFKESYIVEDGQKKIIQRKDYHLSQ